MNDNIPYQAPIKVPVNGIEIVYDAFGAEAAPTMLLVMGLGGQMTAWDEDLCRLLAAQGYQVIRFDNRDIGLSTRFDAAGIPNIPALLQTGMTRGPAAVVPYTLRDMAADAIGLLDAIGVASAHVVGISMGGMIVQEMAIHHPERLRTMISIMSSTSNPALPPPKPEAMAVLQRVPPPDRAAYIESSVESSLVLHGSELPFDEDRVRERAAMAFDRGLNPAGTARQLAAILVSSSRKGALKSVTVPTLVIHGDADPLVPVEGGIDTADAVPGAKRLIIEGMGHSLPPVVWPQVVDAILKHAV